jgi:hypothetical protein
MKKKIFKITRVSRFIYKNGNVNGKSPNAETDPTTTMMTSTVSGVFGHR